MKAKQHQQFPIAWTLVATILMLSSAASAQTDPGYPSNDDLELGYGFVREVEGHAELGDDDDEAVAAEINHPILTGDSLETWNGRTELVLPDGTIVRLDRNTRIEFASIFGSPDSTPDEPNIVRFEQGELQLRTAASAVLDTRVKTSNSVLYLAPEGVFRIRVPHTGGTELVVREGYAEAETASGSAIARAGERIEIVGDRAYADVLASAQLDSLELWAQDLEDSAYGAEIQHVDPRLGYAASSLGDSGEWVQRDEAWAWRPYVPGYWRPFQHGRWVYTPSGITWVSNARWGWLTSHYGSWDYAPGYGWLWSPGSYYSPAAVYWYWGPTYVAWVPAGHYRHDRFGRGVYGWAGGAWGNFGRWTFCPTRYFGRRGYGRYWESGDDLGRRSRFAVPRGVITTDTRGLNPDRWGKPAELLGSLTRRRDASTPRGTLERSPSLPDVTGFIAGRGRPPVTTARPSGGLTRAAALRPLPEDRPTGDRGRLSGPSGDSPRGSLGRPPSSTPTGSIGRGREDTQPSFARPGARSVAPDSRSGPERTGTLSRPESPTASPEGRTDTTRPGVLERIRVYRESRQRSYAQPQASGRSDSAKSSSARPTPSRPTSSKPSSGSSATSRSKSSSSRQPPRASSNRGPSRSSGKVSRGRSSSGSSSSRSGKGRDN